jgi:hypothetical protein
VRECCLKTTMVKHRKAVKTGVIFKCTDCERWFKCPDCERCR